MNKKILFLLLGLIVLSIGMVSAEDTCVDGDQGNFPLSAGNVTTYNVTDGEVEAWDTCASHNTRYLSELICDGTKLSDIPSVDCTDYGTDYECITITTDGNDAGLCAIKCSDSDDQDYETQGVLTFFNFTTNSEDSKSDSCWPGSDTKVVEYYCDGEYASEVYDCADLGMVCLDGACVAEVVEDTCVDSDEDYDYTTAGTVTTNNDSAGEVIYYDECKDSTDLHEMVCDGTSLANTFTNCLYLGAGYECLETDEGAYCYLDEEKTCTDSDGDDPTTVGNVETYNASAGYVTFVDHCDTGTRNINEMTCDGVGLHSEITSCSSYGTGYECFETGEGADCRLADEDVVEIDVEVEEETSKEVSFEFDSAMDLSDFDSSLSSVEGISIHTTDNEIVLKPYYGRGHVTGVTSLVETDEVFLYTTSIANQLTDGTIFKGGKWVGVFYRDLSDNQMKLFGHISATENRLEIIELQVGSTSYSVLTNRAPIFAGGEIIQFFVGSELLVSWGLDGEDGIFNSLGQTYSLEEANELRNSGTGIGTQISGQSTSDGLVVESPATNGAADQVVIQVPTSSSSLSRAAGDDGFSFGSWVSSLWSKFFF
ncbi:hypothetical protein HN681_04975 [archaeon]|jgi:hypothetical protein|nr:hypothetical protein [archaeon]MBT3731322.1 hypothetical protein [archaeon]MBT4670375.1 hypothetical protein [archaeon]MBT5030190.1 hypothetical protein [archaeon]MBT5287743.1 hypothetical protein [archaeon]